MSERKRSLKRRLKQPGLIVAPGVLRHGVAAPRRRVRLRRALHDRASAPSHRTWACPTPGWRPTPTWWGAYGDGAHGAHAADRRRRHRLRGLLNVRHTVRGYEAAGAAAIQLEDQEFPKKCGHTPGRRVIADGGHGAQDPRSRSSRAARATSSIIARTDARTRARARRGAAPRRSLRACRRRHPVRRVARVGGRDAAHRTRVRPAAGGQHGREGHARRC